MVVEQFIQVATSATASIIEGVAAVIIAYASLHALLKYGRSVLGIASIDKIEIRLSLGKSLALALEFLLAADILRTAVAPTWDDIGKLAAVAALRTLLNFFLERELVRHKEAELL